MSYVAIKGGTAAIRSSKRYYHEELTAASRIEESQLIEGLRFACDRIMGEGALYTEKLAAEALRKCGGDLLEAAFYVRAHRSTCQRIGMAAEMNCETIRVIRRISSAFKDIEGGQILGPSCDYVIRLLRTIRDHEQAGTENQGQGQQSAVNTGILVRSALSRLRGEDRIMTLANLEDGPFDITRIFPLPPYPRSALMQIMARGETGAMLAFAYTSMRGYGDVHPTIGDLRLGKGSVRFTHPFTGNSVTIGEIRMTACETVGSFKRDKKDGKLRLSVGFGFCFGYNETKAIAMSILDLAMNHDGYSVGGHAIAANPEIIAHHVDGIESMGFTNHFKLPHYVTFQADLQTFQRARQNDEQQ